MTTAPTDADGSPAWLLGNGRYAVLLTRAGAGCSAYDGTALTRWTPDPVRQTQGFFIYLRDQDDGACWSATFEPVGRAPDEAHLRCHAASVELMREDAGIVTRLDVCVAGDADVELRRLTLTNAGDRPRSIEVATYLEVVLNNAVADAAHPVFSRLFVQTAWDEDTQSLLAWRRPRAPSDSPLFLVHRLIGGAGEITFETDRARFLGRGRTPAAPQALENAARPGSVGNVLDPVLSLRRAVHLAPGASATLTAVLGASSTREGAVALAARAAEPGMVPEAFAGAVGVTGLQPDDTGSHNDAALGLPSSWIAAALAVPVPPIRSELSTPVFRPAACDRAVAVESRDDLRYFNGLGGFTADGREYVIRLGREPSGLRLPPAPWANVIANEHVGLIATESGIGCTWVGNSRRDRLTPWTNDPVSDTSGEGFYLRDEDEGTFRSLTPMPVPGPGDYEVRHGFGSTRYRHESSGIEHDLCVFVPRHHSVRVVRITLHNRSDRSRNLCVFACSQWVLGAKPQNTAGHISTHYDPQRHAIFASLDGASPSGSGWRGGAGRTAFASVAGVENVRVSADRAAFLGPFGTFAAPAAVTSRVPLDGRMGDIGDPCAAFEAPLALAPGETRTITFLLGAAEDVTAARTLIDRLSDDAVALHELVDVQSFWHDFTGRIHITTPAPAIDLMVNGWLTYQTLSCRLWGRTAFYQSGGAYGFRDQLQDAAALIYHDPQLAREQILLHAAHQFRMGDVLHWWHPPEGTGIRTRFADDLLWLPYIVAFYLRTTGDSALLDETVRFVTGPVLDAGEDERMVVPEDSGETATVHEHCCRALDRSLTRGEHGLPLMGVGDWNDGMNRVGREGRGESVWLGFFLYDILTDYIPLCEQRGDNSRAERYRAYLDELAIALQDGGWDGAWYRRAYYDDGAPIGSAQSDECRIDAIAQAWAVLSGAAPHERAEQALDAMEEHLVSEEDGIIRLLTPPFDRTPHDPGYIKGYLPGVRENGGQYTHGALWAVRALAEAGRVDRAAPLLEMLSPVSHTRTPAEVAIYQTEPYVIAADVYGEPPHVGRGGWSWYTGSSGWMLRVALESIIGMEADGGHTLRLRPRIPAAWPGFSLSYRVPGTDARYDIDVVRDAGAQQCTAMESGTELNVERDVVLIPLVADGGVHRVTVRLPAS